MAKDIDKEMAKSIGIKLMLARDIAGLTREQLSEQMAARVQAVPSGPSAVRRVYKAGPVHESHCG